MNKKLLFYILKRVILAIVTIVIVITVTFFAMQLIPGGPFTSEKAISEESMARLEEKYGFIRYRQGDHWDEYAAIANSKDQPAMSLDRSADWHGFFSQSPRKYADWMQAELREEAEFTVADLLSMPKDKKIIVDGIIPIDMLKEISDYEHVFLLFAPDEMKRKHYFDRADKDEVYQFILSFPDGQELLRNVIEALNIDNESERHKIVESGFKYLERKEGDTLENTLKIIEEHFIL